MRMVGQLDNIIDFEITRGEWLALRGSCHDISDIYSKRADALFKLIDADKSVLRYLRAAFDDIGNKHSFLGYEVDIKLLSVSSYKEYEEYGISLSLSAIKVLYNVCQLALVELVWEFHTRTGAYESEAHEILAQMAKILGR